MTTLGFTGLRRAGQLVLLWLAAAIPGWAGEAPERPWPPRTFLYLPAQVELAWTHGTTNLLTNGGFESGLDGWDWAGQEPFVYITHGTIDRPVLEGTNQVLLHAGVLAQTVTLPTNTAGLALSFAVRPTPGQVRVEVQSTNGQVLATLNDGWGALSTMSGWVTASLNLSHFAGQTVRLAWRFTISDTGVRWYIDDFRLTPVPPDTRYDVWFGAQGQPLARLGATEQPGWRVEQLDPGRYYNWRIDTVTASVTNQGTAWNFRTASSGTPAYAVFDPIPSPQCPSQTIPVHFQFHDTNGFPVTNYRTTVRLSAVADGRQPAGVVISEVDASTTNAVECINTSTNEIDLSGWYLTLVNELAKLPQSVRVSLPSGARLGPGQVFTARFGEANPAWPHLRVPVQIWGTGVSALSVVLRNSQAVVVDCCYVSPTVSPPAPVPLGPVSIAMWDWLGVPIASSQGNGMTYQRTGNSDQNAAGDWTLGPGSIGAVNPGLTLPLAPGIGLVPVEPATINLTTQGRWTGQLTVATPATNLVLLVSGTATVFGSNPPFGMSAPFDVVAEACLDLELPPELSDHTGTVTNGVKVRLAVPAAQDVVIHLTSTLPARLGLPENFVIPAGQTEASADLIVVNDPRLTGPLAVTVSAAAPGYATTTVSRVLTDDQKPVLSIELPAEATEGGSFQVRVVSSLPPANPITLTLANEPYDGRVLLSQYAVVLAAGEVRSAPVWVYLTPDQHLSDPVNVTIRASYADWAPGEGTVRLLDSDPHTLAVYSPDVTEAGSQVMVRVVLSAYTWVDRVVSLSSSDPVICPVPATVTIPALSMETSFLLAPGDDSLTNGTRRVTLRATSPGLAPGDATINLFDDDPARLNVWPDPGPYAAGEPFRLFFRANSIDGLPVGTDFLSNATVSATAAGLPLALQTIDPIIGGSDLSWFTLMSPTAATGAVVRVEAHELTGETKPLAIWAYPTPTNVVRTLYDARRHRFLVARLDRPLEALDELSGQPHATDLPLTQTTLLTLADDGDTLHVAFENGLKLARLNLATLQVEGQTNVAPDPVSAAPRHIDALTALPGAPQSVGLVLLSAEGLWRDADLAIFDNLAPRPQSLWVQSVPDGTLAVSAAGNELVYVVRNGSFRSYRFDAQGVLPTDPPWPWTAPMYADRSPQSGDVALDAGFGLLPQGPVFVTALSAFAPPVIYDTVQDVRSSVNEQGRYGRIGGTLEMFEPFTWRRLGEAWAYSLGGNRTQLTTAGGNRWLAVRDSRLMLATVEVPDPAPATDLVVEGEVREVRQPQREADLQFHIRNLGTNPAPAALLGFALPYGFYFKHLTPAYPASTNTHLQQGFELGDLAPGASVDVTATFGLGRVGVFAIGGFAGSAAAETVRTNNLAIVSGTMPAGQPQMRLVADDPVFRGPWVYFATIAGKFYRLESADNPAGPWLTAAGPMQGDGAEQNFPLIVNRSVEFWRLVEE